MVIDHYFTWNEAKDVPNHETKLQISHQDYKNLEFVGVKYIRYANNFLMGVLRSKATMLKILERN
jgi:hypothetical protein